jgi:hypothetical protein
MTSMIVPASLEMRMLEWVCSATGRQASR